MALLVLVILAIVAGAYLVSHPHLFSSSPTSTPTATPQPTPAPTGTPIPGPTGTPVPGPSATPRPGPTGTPVAGPSATPATAAVRTGQITHPQSQIRYIQQQANAKNPQYTFYLNPVQVVQHNLPAYGFSGPVTIVSPPATPTPTAYTNQQGLPQVMVVVKYQGKTYDVFLDEPVQQGPQGIWVIITIRPAG